MSAAAPGVEGPRGLWGALAEVGPAARTSTSSTQGDTPSCSVDVWACLADQLDLGAYVPTPSPDVEERAVEGRDGRRFWVLRSPSLHYLRLDDTDLDLWQRMDGQRNVRQIAVDHFLERGGFVADRLARLVRRLRADGFLGSPPKDAFTDVDRHLQSQTLFAKLAARAG